MIFSKALLNKISAAYWHNGRDSRHIGTELKVTANALRKKIDMHFPVFVETLGGLETVAKVIEECGFSHQFISSKYNINPKRVISFITLMRFYVPTLSQPSWKSESKAKRLKNADKLLRCRNCSGRYYAKTACICPICEFDNAKKED